MTKEKRLILEYHGLVGRIIEALDSYDSDDGHNDIVKLGIVAEHARLESEWRSWPQRKPQRRRR